MSQIRQLQTRKVSSLLFDKQGTHKARRISSFPFTSFAALRRNMAKERISSAMPSLASCFLQTLSTVYGCDRTAAKQTTVSLYAEFPFEISVDRAVNFPHHHHPPHHESLQHGIHRATTIRDIEPESSDVMPPEKKYILVIDDEAGVREVTAEILREANVRTLEAEDGLVGLELFRKYSGQIVLVLLDFSMPGMNGGQVLEQMWKIDSSVPILFFSGYGQHETIRRFRRSGSVGFLQKPYTINELLLAVRQYLKRS